MNSLYIRLDGVQGELVKQLMIDRDCSAQKAGAYILKSFFAGVGQETKDDRKQVALVEKKTSKRFIKPTWEELAGYFHEKGSMTCQDDATTFIDHYTANGWKVGKNQMKDWKAAVRNWTKNKSQFKGGNNGQAATGAISVISDTDF